MDPTPPVPPTAPGAAADSTRGSAVGKLDLQGGDTTIDEKLTIDVELSCYAQLRGVIDVVKKRITERTDPPVPQQTTHIFFLDSALRTALDLVATIGVQLANLKNAYAGAAATATGALAALAAPALPTNRQTPAFVAFTALAPVAVASAAADAAVALIGALKRDTRYFGRQVVIPEQAFALALAHAWETSPSVEFHYPTLFVPPTATREQLMKDVVTAFDAAIEERKGASQALSALLAHVSRLDPVASAFLTAKPALDTARDQFDAAETVFDTVSTRLGKADEKTGLTGLQLMERAAFVASIASDPAARSFYLFAQVVSAGGAFRTVNNFFRALVRSDGLEHSGGCIVTFALFDTNGRLIASDTLGSRAPYQDSRPGIELLDPVQNRRR